MRAILILSLLLLTGAALAQTRPGESLPNETLKDAYERQRAEDARARNDSRALLQNERPAPLGDSRVNAVPAPERYTTQPVPNRK
jgi:hypothetical protein